MNRTLSIEEIAELNSRGRHCSQVVAGERAKETDASDRICRPCMRGALEILEDMLGAEV